jgi:hypothetical protein
MRLLKGALEVWKRSWQLACGVLFPTRIKHEEIPLWGKLRVDEVPISGFQSCNSLRFVYKHACSAAPTTDRARVLRGLGHVSSRKQQDDRLRLA